MRLAVMSRKNLTKEQKRPVHLSAFPGFRPGRQIPVLTSDSPGSLPSAQRCACGNKLGFRAAGAFQNQGWGQGNCCCCCQRLQAGHRALRSWICVRIGTGRPTASSTLDNIYFFFFKVIVATGIYRTFPHFFYDFFLGFVYEFNFFCPPKIQKTKHKKPKAKFLPLLLSFSTAQAILNIRSITIKPGESFSILIF